MEWPTRNYLYLAGAVLLIVSAAIRIVSYPIVSADYISSLSNWMEVLRSNPGLSAFESPFSNYPPLYLYLLKLLSYIPVYDLYAIKTLSLIFDVFIAFVAVSIVKNLSQREPDRSKLFLVFAIMLAIPTVIVNSSLWAQCDVIYASFTLLSLYYILLNKPLPAVIAFGVAFSLKLQAIFFLPVLAGYIIGKRYNLLYLLVIPVTYFITIIPAWLGGGSLVDLFGVYFGQVQEFPALTLSAPTIYAFLGDMPVAESTSTVLAYIGEIAALVTAFLIVIATIRTVRSVSQSEWAASRLIFLSLFCVLAIPFLLPHMHERYFYLADIFSVIYAFFHPRRWYVPVAVIVASFFSYMPFLSGQVPLFAALTLDIWIFSIILLLTIITLLPRFVQLVRAKR